MLWKIIHLSLQCSQYQHRNLIRDVTQAHDICKMFKRIIKGSGYGCYMMYRVCKLLNTVIFFNGNRQIFRRYTRKMSNITGSVVKSLFTNISVPPRCEMYTCETSDTQFCSKPYDVGCPKKAKAFKSKSHVDAEDFARKANVPCISQNRPKLLC